MVLLTGTEIHQRKAERGTEQEFNTYLGIQRLEISTLSIDLAKRANSKQWSQLLCLQLRQR